MVEGSGMGFLVQRSVAYDSVWRIQVEDTDTGVALVLGRGS